MEAEMPIQDYSSKQPSSMRMISSQDLALIEETLKDISPDSTIVEFGPWLGAVSEVLARAGNLHVVDCFIWTADHAKRVPDLFKEGDSFHDFLKKRMDDLGVDVCFHNTTFEAFHWHGGQIAFCMIDSPKKPKALVECLRSVATGLQKGSRLVIKNGNSHRYFEMMAFLQDMIDADVMHLFRADTEGRCNSIALELKVDGAEFAILLDEPIKPLRPSACKVYGGLGHLGTYRLGLITRLVQQGLWRDAYEVLAKMEESSRILRDWDRLEPELALVGVDPEQLTYFSEMMAIQHAKGGLPPPPKSFKASAILGMRAFWVNNVDKPWRARAFHPNVIKQAHAFGYLNWAYQIQDHVRGRTVLDVGCEQGLYGLGYLVAGAKNFLGLDPDIDPNRDWATNLNAGSQKMAFGWTPAELGKMLEPWRVSPDSIHNLSDEHVFDIAVLHNVIEHFYQIESVFEAIARRLKPGGRILYTYHNSHTLAGYYTPSNMVSTIEQGDHTQMKKVGFKPVNRDSAPEKKKAGGLNQIQLDKLKVFTEKFFDIEIYNKQHSQQEAGFQRPKHENYGRHLHLSDPGFETQSLFCLARTRG